MKYDYNEVITADIIDYIREHYTEEEIAERLASLDSFSEELNDQLWIADSVTGNASGSYFFNTYEAEAAIAHNWDILSDALSEFDWGDVNPIDKGAEWCDVTIRCYLLSTCIYAALESLAAQVEPIKTKA